MAIKPNEESLVKTLNELVNCVSGLTKNIINLHQRVDLLEK